VSSGAEGDQWGRGAIKKVETDNALLRSQGGDQIGSDQGKGFDSPSTAVTQQGA
jgi:hypothetical protein